MFKGKIRTIVIAALIGSGFAVQAVAQAPRGCIELKSTALVEKEVVDANGNKAKKMVPADKVVPGTEVTWTVTASNICQKPAENVTFDNPVPPHMSYVANSATGPGSDISFSLDGKAFAAPAGLTVNENGATRPARADEYKHIRWAFKQPLQPGATANASFRAVLN